MKSATFRFFAISIGLAAVARLLLPFAAVPRGFVARFDAGGVSIARLDRQLRFGAEGSPSLPPAPFMAIWQGNLNIAQPGPQRFYGHAPDGTTEIILDSRTITIAPAGFWAVDVPTEPGWHRLLIRLSVPGDRAGQFEVGRILDGREEPLDERTVFRGQPSPRALALDRIVRAASLGVDFLLAALAAGGALLGARQAVRAIRLPTRGEALWGAVAASALASLFIAYRIATLQLVIGSVEGHQIYQYVEEFAPRSLLVAGVSAVAALSLLAIPPSVFQRAEWIVVSLWAGVATLLQALLRSLTPFSFEHIFVNDGANSFYGATLQVSAAEVLRDFAHLRFELPLHAYSNMPGKLMLVYALENLSKNPATLAWLVVGVSNIGGILLYLLVRDLFADRRVALYSYALYLFVPAKLYLFPLLNTVTPPVVFCCLFLLLRWLLTSKAAYAALLGAALYGLTFFEPLALTSGLLFLALIWWALMKRQIAWRTLLWQAGVSIAAFGATYLVVAGVFHFNLLAAMRDVGGDAAGFNDRFERPYALWVQQNLIDFFFGVGICQALMFCMVLGAGAIEPGSWWERLTRPEVVISIALAATLAAIDLIGVNRGEIVRLWLFLACLFQIPAAFLCARLENRAAIALVLTLTILQDALGTSMIGFIQA